MKINQIIREKRKELSLTQEQVAVRLGVSASAVNKWEKGSTYPDITLLPALARLLKMDLNTLMSFNDDLTDIEIENFVNEVDKAVREQDFETAFQKALNKIHEYPTCDKLIFSVVLHLEGSLFLYDVSGQEHYKEMFETFYERLSGSEIPEIRETAVKMLISYNRNRKNFSRAEELIGALPSSSTDKEEQLAVLYTQQEKYSDALKIWEHRILNGITGIQTALFNMLEIAVKEGRMEDADFYADIYERASRLFCVPKWIPYNAKLRLSVIKQDKIECLSALKSMLPAMREIWRPQDCPLYSHMNVAEMDVLRERLLAMMQNEMENGSEFSFLNGNQEYKQLLEELKNRDILNDNVIKDRAKN